MIADFHEAAASEPTDALFATSSTNFFNQRLQPAAVRIALHCVCVTCASWARAADTTSNGWQLYATIFSVDGAASCDLQRELAEDP
ncbi:hypothetical protein P0D69_28255 [Paraburkholderia sediminicola]|uniref:hypothetical protein n=1 Tax=Paraburkholderia sediminicola TaxID=458836 RepID=UPI0038B8CC65